jgi:hypothetical protein
LPSALDRPRIAVAVWTGSRAFVPTGAAAEDPGTDDPRVWSATLRGSGVVPDALEMVLASRCHGVDARCRRVRLSIDGARSTALALRCGWHWYYTRPRGAVPQANVHEVTLQAPPGCPRPKLAVQSLALVAERCGGSAAVTASSDVGPPT